MGGLIKIGLAVVALAGVAHGGDITDITSDCGSTMGTISKVTMQGCDSNVASGFCPAPQGSMAHGQFTFTANQTINSLTCDMSTSAVPGVGIPCPEADGCKSIANNVTCPIKAGTEVVYNIDIDVLPLYPKMQLLGNINLKLNKNDKTDAICMQLPIDILPPVETTVVTTTKAPVTTNTTAAPTTTKGPVTTTKGNPTTASTSGSSVTQPVSLLLAAMASAFLALF